MTFANAIKYPLLLSLSLSLLGCGDETPPNQQAAAKIHVDTLTVDYVNLRLSSELPGRVTAFKEAEVRPQITGIVKSRLYEEGSSVQEGDTLFLIDPTTYQSTVNSAKAELKKAQSTEANAKKEMERYAELLKEKLSSQQLFDQAEATYLEAKAETAISQAALDYANIELSYTKIKAPISGQAGFSNVSEGSLLTSGQTDYLTTIIQTDNVYVDMQQSAVNLYKIKRQFRDALATKPVVPVTLTLEDGTTYQQPGTLGFVDTQVEGSTGTVTLRAVFPNSDGELLAGMYVRAHIAYPEARDYLVVPQNAVVRSQSGAPSVYVVNEDNVVEKKSITLSNEVGSSWVVEKGLEVGDRIITNNLTKIKSDLSVVVDSNITSAELAANTTTPSTTDTAE
ncbi:efflux RND transporter periplasmic adaptor subunit [Psychromonas sp. KJ10-2]|uniref:efflux RND transporter periplasmic adaptor subunit n=1 Tax=Psychromonas sp. KJ10-2 TaxID=3391822 RepID=UPI0039B365B4